MSWAKLPTEVHEIIIDHLFDDVLRSKAVITHSHKNFGSKWIEEQLLLIVVVFGASESRRPLSTKLSRLTHKIEYISDLSSKALAKQNSGLLTRNDVHHWALDIAVISFKRLRPSVQKVLGHVESALERRASHR